MNRGWVRVAASVIGIGAIAAAWLGLGPRSLGGSVDYVAVAKGSSMSPAFRVGDLALVKPRPVASYAVGNVIASRTDYGRVVLHRIAAIERGRFVTKGDNNPEVDQYRPLPTDVIGALWLRVPYAGRVLGVLRPPGLLVPLGIAIVAWLVLSDGKPARRGKVRRERHPRPTQPAPLRNGAPATIHETYFGGAAAALIAFGLLTTTAFLRPARAPAELPIAHQGSFRYAGTVAGEAGPESRIETGEPAFLRSTSRLRVRFAYGFEVDGKHAAAGDWRLVAELSAPNGWRRIIPLTPVSPFQGDRFEASGIVDLRALRGIILATEDRTGVVNPTYALAVRAQVNMRGTADGYAIKKTFAPEMRFSLDALQAQLQVPDHKVGDPIGSHEEDTVTVPGGAANHITLVKIPVPVGPARALGLAGMASAIVVMVWAGLQAVRGRREDEPARIAARWGSALVSIQSPIVTGSFVTTSSFEDLVRLADRYDRQILHHTDGPRHTYLVEEGSRVFRYVAQDERALARVDEAHDLAYLRPLSDGRRA